MMPEPSFAGGMAGIAETLPATHERGFAFEVPRSRRKEVAAAMRILGAKHGFEVDSVGFFGNIRCTYRQRNAGRVHAFIEAQMFDMGIGMIRDYQRRYGVVED